MSRPRERVWPWALWTSVFALLSLPGNAQDLPDRMVIGTGIACHELPNSTSPSAYSYKLGERVAVSNESRNNGGVWYFDQGHVSGSRPSCWIAGSETAEFDWKKPEPALISMADRVLQPRASVTFAAVVEVENFLIGEVYAKTLQASGLLQFRRLQVIALATVRGNEERLLGGRNVLATAWALNHRELLGYYEPDAGFYVRAEPYWKLYDLHKQEPWADDLAWAAAQHTHPTDACMSDCVLQAQIIDGPLQYWRRLPKGANIDKAIELAAERAKYAASMACYDSVLGRGSQSSVPPEMIRQIRNSLSPVTAPGKRQLLSYLNDAEKKCAVFP